MLVAVINYCQNYPCQNGGTCNQQFGQYTCACPVGFTGTKCEAGIIKNKQKDYFTMLRSNIILW